MNKKIIAASAVFLLIGLGVGYCAADFTYKSQIDQLESEVLEKEVLNRVIEENIVEKTTNIVAVNKSGEGILATLTVDLTPGTGEIFVKSDPIIGFDFQNAQVDAVKAAANFIDLPMNEKEEGIPNLHTHFKISGETDEEVNISRVDGPSAGAAAAIATIAALRNENIRKDVVITGTISPDGSIGLVGGVKEKAEAAEAADMELFLVPEGPTVYVDNEWKPVSYLESYAADQGWDMEIKEVSNLEEATKYFYK